MMDPNHMRKVVDGGATIASQRGAMSYPKSLNTIAYWLLLALGVLFTVEPRQPLLALGQLIQFSTVEVLLFALLGLWGLSCLLARRFPRFPQSVWLPVALFWGSQVVATLFASAEQITALKFTYRLTLGIFTAWCAYDLLYNHPQRWQMMLKAVALGGAVVGVIGVLEAVSGGGSTLADSFRVGVARVGDLERISATLTYPTITALVLELTLPLLLVWMVAAQKRWQKIGLGLLLLMGMVTLILTLSRAGIALLGLIFGAMAVGVWWKERREQSTPLGKTFPVMALGAGATLVGLTILLLYFNPTARLRLVSETESEWYRATYQSEALPTLQPGARVKVPVTITNTSPRPWESSGEQPFLLSYHLYHADGRLLTYDGARTLLADTVAPGEQVSVEASLYAPTAPGDYLVAWDMLQEKVSWFSWKQNDPYTMTLTVAGTPATNAELNITETPAAVVRIPTPTRFELWGIAFDMVRASPLLGIGPDTFRLRYGYAMGYERFDPHIHTNNQYIEFLVGSGVVGLCAFLLFSGVLAVQLWRTLTRQTGEMWRWQWTLVLLIGTWYVHGMVDSFWQFTPTYILFWLLTALALTPATFKHE